MGKLEPRLFSNYITVEVFGAKQTAGLDHMAILSACVCVCVFKTSVA